MPGYANHGPGLGLRMGLGRGRGSGGGPGFGGGRGWRHWFRATGLPGWMRFGGFVSPYSKQDPEVEKQALKRQAEALQSELDLIRRRLGEMENGPEAQ